MTIMQGVTHSCSLSAGPRERFDPSDIGQVAERWGMIPEHARAKVDPAARMVLVAMAGLSVGFGWAVDEAGTFAMWSPTAGPLIWVSPDWLERWGPGR